MAPAKSLEEVLFDPQRAIRSFGGRPLRTLSFSLLSSLVFVPAVWAAQAPLATLWREIFSSLLGWCGIALRPAGNLSLGDRDFGAALPSISCLPPSLAQWAALGLVSAALLWAGGRLPERFKPVAFWLRLVSAVTLTSVVYFAWRPAAFPYDFALYYRARALGTLGLLLLAPLVLGLLYYPLDRSSVRRALITLSYLGFVALSLPLELTLDALVCHWLSLAFLPLAFVLLGPVLQIIWFAAFFSYGVSHIDASALD